MFTIKVGTFPGELKELAVESGATVKAILDLANISAGSESEATLDGNVVSMDTAVSSGSLLLITKRIKAGQ